MRQLLVLSLALLIGCSSDLSLDQFGNVYPVECRGDLSTVDAMLMPASPEVMRGLADSLRKPRSGRLYGLTLNRRIIIYDNTLSGWKLDDLLRHERCHVLVGEWHA